MTTNGSVELTTAVLDKFVQLANKLSPENLHCDGEISRSQAAQRKRQIEAEWRQLEKEAGYAPGSISEDAVWRQYMRSLQDLKVIQH